MGSKFLNMTHLDLCVSDYTGLFPLWLNKVGFLSLSNYYSSLYYIIILIIPFKIDKLWPLDAGSACRNSKKVTTEALFIFSLQNGSKNAEKPLMVIEGSI